MKYSFGKRINGKFFNKTSLKRQFLLLIAIFILAITAASFNLGGSSVRATVPGNNTRVSLTGSGTQSTGDSNRSIISRDGRFVVFQNNQNNFAGSDTNNAHDVFVRNLTNSTVIRASVSSAGVGGNGHSGPQAISETGRYIAFGSVATNLIDGRTISSSYRQMYLRDTVSGTTTILTEISPGTFANDNIDPVDVSTDGRFVLFRSYATNLGPTITNGWHYNVFLLDRDTNTISWVNAQAPNGSGYGNDTYGAQMSCDGSFIVFDSSASYLGLPYSAHIDVFLLDRRGGDKLINITGSANGAALNPRISCNGNYIGFASYAYNLDPNFSTPINYHAYVYDRIAQEFKLADQNSSGALANASIIGLASHPLFLSLSDKGKVVFGSAATNLDAAAPSGHRQLYVRDLSAGTTELLTRDSGGVAGNNASEGVYISLDGKLAAYTSLATNLVSGDTNGQRDIFVSETGF